MTTPPTVSADALIAATSQIVSAYIANRPNEKLNLTALMADVYGTLRQLGEQVRESPRTPIVPIEDSVKADYLVCLEDGKRVKMLKRHLKLSFNMTPEQYRARWSLPESYPMVAPNYAKVRSNLAKQIGLGKRDAAVQIKKAA